MRTRRSMRSRALSDSSRRFGLQRVDERLQLRPRVGLILEVAAEEASNLLDGGDDIRAGVARGDCAAGLLAPFDCRSLLGGPLLHFARKGEQSLVDGALQESAIEVLRRQHL